MEGEVPLEMWQNELAHIQMALGVDAHHGAGDFALTDMKEKVGRRPENVAMDDYELPKYVHVDRGDGGGREDEDEFMGGDEKSVEYGEEVGSKPLKEEVGQVGQEYFARKAIQVRALWSCCPTFLRRF